MTRLCAYTPPEGILDSIAQYLTTDEHIDLPVDKMQVVTDGDTTDRDKDKILVSLGMDFQQAATPVSVYARIMVRVEEPQSGTLTGLLPDPVYLSFRLAYHIKRFSLKSNTLISCDIDAAPTLMVEGLRQYAYMVLLCTVPMTGVAGGGGSDTPKEPFKDEYSGDSAKLILNEDCDPELGGMWTITESRRYTSTRDYFQIRMPALSSGGSFVAGLSIGLDLYSNRVHITATHKYLITLGLTVPPTIGTGTPGGAYTVGLQGFMTEETFDNEPAPMDVRTEMGNYANLYVSSFKQNPLQQAVIRAPYSLPEGYVWRWHIYGSSSPLPCRLTHFQVTDITEHPELAPANANKLLAESNRFMAELKKKEAALAAGRTEGKEFDFGDKT